MKDDTVVGGIEVVLMGVPIGGGEVYLHIAVPLLFADTQVHIGEIGTGVYVVLPHGENFHGSAIGGRLRKARPQTMLPNIVQKNFRHVAFV